MQHDSPEEQRTEIAAILRRQDANGLPEHISEAEIGRELGLEATQVGSLLHEMQRDGQVNRTAHGNWELTAAEARDTDPRPHPHEPRQG
jgi:DNA-binding IclR family transcriptional regulator